MTTMATSIFSPAERAAWQPEQSYTPSTWAAAHRIVSAPSPFPGRWRNERSPFLAGIMDSVIGDAKEIVIMKSAQIGFSELVRNILGFWIDQDPGDCLFLLPSEAAGKSLFSEKIKPLIESTPRIKAHLGMSQDDLTMTRIVFDSMSVYLAWSGSAQSMASRPTRYLVCDETDKYDSNIKKEADPISLALNRLRKYGDRAKAIIGSTPTLDTGNIATRYASCGIRFNFYIPCPACQKHQTLIFSQLKWDKSQKASGKNIYRDAIESNPASAWYECKFCNEKINDAQKNRQMKQGCWAAEDAQLENDGKPITPIVKTKRIGFHISALYDPAVRFNDIAAKFIDCAGDYPKTIDFYNSTLGLPYEDKQAKVETSQIRTLASFAPDFTGQSPILPAWTTGLFASADTQQDRFYYIVRAWGPDYQSQLIAHGVAFTFEDLYRLTIGTSYHHAGLNEKRHPAILLIDSGGTTNAQTGASRTAQVYQFADEHPQHVIPLKGMGSGEGNSYSFMRQLQGRQWKLLRLQTDYYKSYLHSLITDTKADQPKWLPLRNIDDDYCQQMASNHLVKDRTTGKMAWKQVTEGRADHYLHAETYCLAWADHVKIGSYKSEAITQTADTSQAKPKAETYSPPTSTWASRHRGKY